MKRIGKIKSSYSALKRNGDLAELIGIVLGDGHLYKHDRCDSLRIVGDSKKMGFVIHSAKLIKEVFGKDATIVKVKSSNAVTITIYEQHIAKRINLPHGSRKDFEYTLPSWISRNRSFRIRFLRGLYEAEGSESHHAATSTHKLFFANNNPHLLKLVANLVTDLGFTQNTYVNKVQISRGAEVQKLKNLLQFRSY